jgi:hypothetical protein
LDPLDGFRTLVSLRNHFRSGSRHSFHKNPRTRCSPEKFASRPDAGAFGGFRKIREDEVVEYLVANLSDRPDLWVPELFTHECVDRHKRYRARIDSLTYSVDRELPRVDLPELFSGSHPLVLREWMGGRTSLQTLCVLDQMTRFSDTWRTSPDPIVREGWERISRLSPFVVFDPGKIEKILERRGWRALAEAK